MKQTCLSAGPLQLAKNRAWGSISCWQVLEKPPCKLHSSERDLQQESPYNRGLSAATPRHRTGLQPAPGQILCSCFSWQVLISSPNVFLVSSPQLTLLPALPISLNRKVGSQPQGTLFLLHVFLNPVLHCSETAQHRTPSATTLKEDGFLCCAPKKASQVQLQEHHSPPHMPNHPLPPIAQGASATITYQPLMETAATSPLSPVLSGLV